MPPRSRPSYRAGESILRRTHRKSRPPCVRLVFHNRLFTNNNVPVFLNPLV